MFDRMSKWISDNFGGAEEDADFEEEKELAFSEEDHSPRASGLASFPFGKKERAARMVVHETPRIRMVVAAPNSFNEARLICEQVKNKRPVVLNLENVDEQVARRIADFMQGAVCALDASIYKVSSVIVVIGPHDVEISGEYGEAEE